jgi:nucleotide-binding universal stress UspA family protein
MAFCRINDGDEAVPEIATIIVHADDAEDCPGRLRLAANIARREGATLVALHVALRAANPFAMPCTVDCVLTEAAARRIRTAMRHAEEHFLGLAHDMPSARWRVIDAEPSLFDDIAPTLVREAHFADLVIVGQAGTGETGDHRLGALPQEVLLRGGRPVLVVPRHCAAIEAIDRVVVCWRSDRESARAVRDALPLLRRAAAVRILQIGAPGESQAEAMRAAVDLESLVDYLAVHDVAATLQRDDNLGSEDIAMRLLHHAAAFGADLLVMGGYSHSRLHEYLLGGVTRQVLTEAMLPVFISH